MPCDQVDFKRQCCAPPNCLFSVCPWDSLSQSLTLPELERLCCASAPLYGELTVAEGESAPDSDQVADVCNAEPSRVSCRKLLAPLLTLKIETAEAELRRVSIGNIRVLRIWNYRSLNVLAEALTNAGGPQVLRSLERIRLAGCPLRPDLVNEFLLPAFTHSQLRHLNLEKNQVTDDALCSMAESGALDVTSLESINLRFNKIGSRGAQALASCACFPTLKWVNLKMNSVGDDGAIAFAERLQPNSVMRLLNLRRQMPPLTDRAAVAFATMLKHNSTLEQLRLRQNRIGDDGARALANQLADHVGRLQTLGLGARFELDLEQNRVKDDGADAFLRALKGISGPVRVELLLHGNPVTQVSLAQGSFGDVATVVGDPRLAFQSKAEGLLW